MFTSVPAVETAAGAMAEVDAARESAISRQNAATKRSTRYAAVIAGVVLFRQQGRPRSKIGRVP
jgi:hypothetical protein